MRKPSQTRKTETQKSSRDARGLPQGRDLAIAEIEELRRIARDYQFVLFGILQVAAIMGVHPDIISAVANHKDSPFLPNTKKARPEWVLAFLQKPPVDFAVR